MYIILIILGVAIVLSPFTFNFAANSYEYWLAVISGAVLVLISVIEGIAHHKRGKLFWLDEWLGAGAIIAPFILGFSSHITITIISIGLGVVIVGLAGIRIFYDTSKPHIINSVTKYVS